tara:strand:- start:117 stop:221 length:105 start_codon:yes stop_codon:yes gene_type:complete
MEEWKAATFHGEEVDSHTSYTIEFKKGKVTCRKL